jgi:hypothetical protein
MCYDRRSVKEVMDVIQGLGECTGVVSGGQGAAARLIRVKTEAVLTGHRVLGSDDCPCPGGENAGH